MNSIPAQNITFQSSIIIFSNRGPPAPFTVTSNSAFTVSVSGTKDESSTAFKENSDKTQTIKQEALEKDQEQMETTGTDKKVPRFKEVL